MNNVVFESLDRYFDILRLDITSAELATIAEEQSFDGPQLEAISCLFKHLSEKKTQTTINTIFKMSRLPQKDPKTFDNFDFFLSKEKTLKNFVLFHLLRLYMHTRILLSLVLQEPGKPILHKPLDMNAVCMA